MVVIQKSVCDIEDDTVLRVNLSDGNITSDHVSLDLRRHYVGGAGINTKFLFDSQAMNHDALSASNCLIFGIGPAVGTGVLAGNRCTITAKSPLTGLYGDSNIGGDFTLRMRDARIAHIVIEGKSLDPVYLLIAADGTCTLRDAKTFWGVPTDTVTDMLEKEHGKGAEIACIGPAGEKLVRFAVIVMSKCHVAGRMGMGCVMGSKRLKAIVIERRSNVVLPVFDKGKLDALKKLWLENCRRSVVSKMGELDGTLFLIEKYDKVRHMPIMNCQASHHSDTKKIYSQNFKNKYQVSRQACFACPVGCAKVFAIPDGPYKGEKGDRIDYGTVASIGSSLGIFDWGEILHLKLLSDSLGVDTVELGGVIAMYMEARERKVPGVPASGGDDPHFGSSADADKLLRMIVSREGVGNILAEGASRAAKEMGVSDYAFCIKNATTGLLSKKRLAWSLGYITSTRGGDHLKNFPFTMLFGGYFSEVVAKHIFSIKASKVISDPKGKGRIVWWHENYKYAVDSLGICIFAIHGLPNTGNAFFDNFSSLLKALYGFDISPTEIFLASERTYQLQNAFNVASGLLLSDYKWPVRKKEPGIDDEHLEDSTIKTRDAPGMLPEYFLFRGLDSEGRPTRQRWADLNLLDYSDRAGLMDNPQSPSLSDALSQVRLEVKLTNGEKFKNRIISAVLIKLLERKDSRASKKYRRKTGSI